MENNITISNKDKAYLIHNRIIASGQIILNALFDMCRDLKTMRDDNLFTELGYDTFEDYSEQACGIKQRQAYSYISAYEKLGENYLKENAHWGITKLELLAQIPSYEREEFLEKNDVENLSTRELKKQVEEFKSRTEQLTFDLESANKENQELTQQIKDMQDSMEDTPLIDAATVKLDEEVIQAAVDEAVEQVKADNEEIIEKLKNQLENEKAKAKLANDSKNKKIKEAKEKAVADANKKIDKLLAEKAQTDEKLQQAVAKAKAAGADTDIATLKVYFDELQSTATKCVSTLNVIKDKNPDTASKLRNAMITALTGFVDELGS